MNRPPLPPAAANASRPRNRLNNNRASRNPLETIKSLLDKARELESIDIDQDLSQFVGMCLFSHTITLKKFLEQYPDDSKIYTALLKDAGAAQMKKKDPHVIEAYCYIPEISGILPFPSYDILSKYSELLSSGVRSSSTVAKITAMIPALVPELVKVSMHPKFFKISYENLNQFQPVVVEFTAPENQALYVGIYKQPFGQPWEGPGRGMQLPAVHLDLDGQQA